MSNVTQLLNAIDPGDAKAAEELLPLIYDELRKLAAVRMAAHPRRKLPECLMQANEFRERVRGMIKSSLSAVRFFLYSSMPFLTQSAGLLFFRVSSETWR